MRWGEFELEQPKLAEIGRRRLGEPGVVLVATIRSDGSPRLSPIEPLFWDQDLWLSMLWGSRKAADLLRDPRILVHNTVRSREGTDGEYKVRGLAVPELDLGVQHRYADVVKAQIGWDPVPGEFHLFRVDIDDVTFIRYENPGDQFVARWPAQNEFVRRATSATRVGDPEALDDLFADRGT